MKSTRTTKRNATKKAASATTKLRHSKSAASRTKNAKSRSR